MRCGSAAPRSLVERHDDDRRWPDTTEKAAGPIARCKGDVLPPVDGISDDTTGNSPARILLVQKLASRAIEDQEIPYRIARQNNAAGGWCYARNDR